MSFEIEGGLALIKAYGGKALLGMIGAAMLYFALPPINSDGTFNKREFVWRLVVAGMFSCVFGDSAVDLLTAYFPLVNISIHTGPIYLMVGAPGWWISRVVALYLYQRQDKDALAVIKEAKDVL